MRFDAADLQRIFADVLGELATRFDDADIRYMIVGGIAVGLHTAARATKDIDFAILADEDQTRALVAAQEGAGWSARIHGAPGPGAVIRFSRTGGDGVARWVDVLCAGTPFEERALSRARQRRLFGRSIPVVSVEDLIVFKLIAGRPQDLVDVYNLLRDHRDTLDDDYLKRSAEEWELGAALDRARASSAD
jgi:predicted nucleotidyltransferase